MFNGILLAIFILALIYPLALFAAVRAIRYTLRNKTALAAGERRVQYPRLRLAISILTVIPVIAIFTLLILVMLWLVQADDIDFVGKVGFICFLGISFSLIMVTVLLYLRQANKKKPEEKDGERRQRKHLRFIVDAVGLMPIVAMILIVIMAAWAFVEVSDITLDPHIRLIAAFAAVYFFLMLAGLSLFRSMKKNEGRTAGTQDRPPGA